MSVTPEPPRGDRTTTRAVMIGAGAALVIFVTILLIVSGNPATIFFYGGLAPILVTLFRSRSSRRNGR
jgi:flagellar biosynthesis/type III secretory pathway M-ring protein FliF/YscJ